MGRPGSFAEPNASANSLVWLTGLLRAPKFAEPVVQREANVLFSVLRAQAVGILSTAVLVVFVSPTPASSVVFLVLSALPTWIAAGAAHTGRLRWGSYLAIGTALLSTIGSTLLVGGIRSPIVLILVFGPLVAAILRGRQALLTVGACVLLFLIVDLALERAGLAPLAPRARDGQDLLPAFIGTSANLAILVAILYIYSREVDRAHAAEVDAVRRALESERRLADLVREAPDGIAVLGEDGRLLSVNAALERMSGYSASELIGQHLLDLPGAPDPETRKTLQRGLDEIGGRAELAELSLVRKDGSPYVVETNPSTLVLPGGERILQVVVRDVTARVEAERRQRRLELDLQDARRMEGLGRLAGGLAHDLRNMLTPVLLNVGDLREEPALPASARVMVDEIEVAGRRASDLLGQILAFARRQILDVAVVDLNRELRALEPMLRRLIRGDIEISFVFDAALRPIRADRAQLGQVVVNLVANARDAMPAGGRLTIETRNVDLFDGDGPERAPIAPGPYSCLTVTDTGEGMSADVRDHVFDPFFTTKGASEGVGLGLATVHGIVSQSGGSIVVESEPGKGAAFRVYLPSVAGGPEETSESQPAQEMAPARARPPRLLVVDDEPLVRATVVRTLRRGGMEVLEAETGADAIALAKSCGGNIDLLVTDVVMPLMGGPELAEALESVCPGIPVLFLSGYTDLGVARAGLLRPGATLLTKPFAASDLLEHVHALLGSPRA